MPELGRILFLPGDGIGAEVMEEVRRIIGWLARRQIGFAVEEDLVGGAAYWMFARTPTAFIPTEDQGMIYVNVTTPVGATVERTEQVMDKIEAIASDMKSVENISMV